jgi:hypothetical protein
VVEPELRRRVDVLGAVPRPCSSVNTASLSSGMRMRLTRKPGESFAVTAVLLSRATTAFAAS